MVRILTEYMRRIRRSAPHCWHPLALDVAAGDAAHQLRDLLEFLDASVGISASEFAEAGFTVPTDLAAISGKDAEAALGSLEKAMESSATMQRKMNAMRQVDRVYSTIVYLSNE